MGYNARMSTRDIWEEAFRRFDPAGPPARSEWRVDRPHGPMDTIFQRLNRGFEKHRILLSGTIGTGKSTELRALAERRAERDFVVSFDVQRHLSEVLNDSEALERIEPWELAVLMALAVYRAARENLEDSWRCKSLPLFEAAWSKLEGKKSEAPRVELGKLAGSIAVAASSLVDGGSTALLALGGAATNVKWDRPIGRRERVPEQDPRVVDLIDAINHMFGEIERAIQQRTTEGRRLLLVVDGLDRIRDRDSALRLILRSDSLARLDCRQVLTAPFALRHDPALADVRGFRPFILVNEPVLDHGKPERPNLRAIAFFREVYARRTADLAPDLIPQPLLDRLAYYSGGRARDFIHLVQEVAGYAWDERKDEADARLIDRVLDERRRLIENGLTSKDLSLLRTVMDDPRARLEPSAEVERLLTHGLLLPYPNESEWFHPHPLLTLGLLRRS